MNTILILLSLAGVAAVLLHMVRAGFRLLSRGVDGLVAGGLAENRARRGDLTGLAEADRERLAAGGRRRRAAAELALWTGLLAAPPLTPWPEALYAAYALLWILPRGRR